MAELLTTAGIVSSIEEIIRKADFHFTLVSPYLKLSRLLKQRLKEADERQVKMTIIYGKEKLKNEQYDTLNKFSNLSLFYYEDLHAKCYYNENKMVITSMNLHEYSEQNNREMGVLLNNKDDKEIFEDAIKEIKSIKKLSTTMKELRHSVPHRLHSEYQNENNFYFPLLIELLRRDYPRLKFEYDQESITSIMKNGVRLIVDRRVRVKFNNTLICKRFGNIIEKELSLNGVKNERCFVSMQTVYYYLPKKYQIKITEDEQGFISNYFLNFIKKTILTLEGV